jgi:glycosyltransferase involved in cell wall biosynthesis
MIGVYNGAAYLREAIESVRSQTYRPFELIVVDDGSDDGSAEIAQAFEEVQYIYQPRAGNGAARNRAVEAATADFFAFLDADDRFVPDKLERQMNTLGADGGLDMVFGHVREFVSPELGDEERRAIRPPAPTPLPWTSPNLMLIRRASFERVGGFSTSLRVGVTVDWFARASEAGLRSVVLPDVMLERRLHTENNGLRERDARNQYLHVLKAAMDRRRAAGGTSNDRG